MQHFRFFSGSHAEGRGRAAPVVLFAVLDGEAAGQLRSQLAGQLAEGACWRGDWLLNSAAAGFQGQGQAAHAQSSHLGPLRPGERGEGNL